MTNLYDTDLKLHIDGERLGQAGRATHRVINPAAGETLGELPNRANRIHCFVIRQAANNPLFWRG
jgi:hypothetical protein